MKKISSIIIFITMLFTFTACNSTRSNDEYEQKEQEFRFVRVCVNNNTTNTFSERLYIDTETGIMYVALYDGGHRGLSVVMNTDGTPMIYEGEW